jgi:4-hydroxy-3-methylbut-2-en-1-yl diphosphate synthase IspG/GcpE
MSKYHLSVLSQLARSSSVEMARTLGARLRTGTNSGSIKQEKQLSYPYTLLLTEANCDNTDKWYLDIIILV